MTAAPEVTLLLTASGAVVSIYESADAARAKRDAYNADPFVAPGEPDLDAPYSVETWMVTASAEGRAA